MLGKWHPFKELAALVFRKYLHINIVSSYFALFPTGTCYNKPRLTSILSMLGFHAQAYPVFRDQLQAAILHPHTLANGNMDDLMNLRDLYELYIPTV
jgi:hypothetical protein